MLGADTVVFTRKGFKKVYELELYDDVMTDTGKFEPIIAMSEWDDVDKCVYLSTGEHIYCSSGLLWWIRARNMPFFTDELRDDTTRCDEICEIQQVTSRKLYDAYDFAVVVPTCVPYEYLLSSVRTRLDFFTGLVDSPICELGSRKFEYIFYTKYEKLAVGIVSLVRSLAWGVDVDDKNGVFCIKVAITSHFDEITPRDKLKKTFFNSSDKTVRIVGIEDVNGMFGRSIKVNNGGLVVGYSFVPVE